MRIDEELARNMVLAVLTNDLFITEVLRLAISDPAKFRQNTRDLIQRSFELELPRDKRKVEAVLMAISIAVKIQESEVETLDPNDIRKGQFRATGKQLIDAFGVENLDDFEDILNSAARNIEDMPPSMDAPPSPTQVTVAAPPPPASQKRPLPTIPKSTAGTAKQSVPPTSSAAKVKPPLPPKAVKAQAAASPAAETSVKRPPPPSFVPHSPKFASFRSELLEQIKNVYDKYDQFSKRRGGLELANNYLNASNSAMASIHLNALIKELGLGNVEKIVKSMVAKALIEKTPVDIKSAQADIAEVIGILNAARDRIHGMNCAEAAHAAIDKLTENLQDQSEAMKNKSEKTGLIKSIMQKRDKPDSEEDTGEISRKRNSGSFDNT